MMSKEVGGYLVALIHGGTMRPTHFIANEISPLTGEPDYLFGAPVVVLGHGGMVGNRTVVILEDMATVKARALSINPSLAPHIADLFDDTEVHNYSLTESQEAELARHGIARDSHYLCTELDIENLRPVPGVN